MPQQVTYDLIEPNIAELDVQGERVDVTWKCPVTGKIVDTSTAMMKAGGDPMAGEVKAVVSRTLIAEAIRFVSETIAHSVGGVAGRVAQQAAVPTQMGLSSKAIAPKYTEAMRQKAIVEAFKQVKEKFNWDEDRGQFVAV
jgi:hypothetical protein